jgi:hypothetical protein
MTDFFVEVHYTVPAESPDRFWEIDEQAMTAWSTRTDIITDPSGSADLGQHRITFDGIITTADTPETALATLRTAAAAVLAELDGITATFQAAEVRTPDDAPAPMSTSGSEHPGEHG